MNNIQYNNQGIQHVYIYMYIIVYLHMHIESMMWALMMLDYVGFDDSCCFCYVKCLLYLINYCIYRTCLRKIRVCHANM